ncbi:hypothetical protein YC2023_077532 [Brassica napus]
MEGTVSGGYRERLLSGYRDRLLSGYRSERDISAGEGSEETTGEGEWREKENCQDGYWEQLRTAKYRERNRGEMDRSGQKKMAGRPIRVCNGGRESVCPSARSSGSFYDQFESGDPGMRPCTDGSRGISKIGVVLWGVAVMAYTARLVGQGVTDWLRGCGAECVLTDPFVIRVWFWDAKHGWCTVCSGWLVGDQAVSLCLLGSCGDERDISAGEGSEEEPGEGERREKENCHDDRNTEKETDEKWIGADRKRWLEGRSESVMAGVSLSAFLRGVLVHFMTSSSLEIWGCAFCTGYGIELSVDGSVMTGPRLVLDGGKVLLTGYGAVEPSVY